MSRKDVPRILMFNFGPEKASRNNLTNPTLNGAMGSRCLPDHSPHESSAAAPGGRNPKPNERAPRHGGAPAPPLAPLPAAPAGPKRQEPVGNQHLPLPTTDDTTSPEQAEVPPLHTDEVMRF